MQATQVTPAEPVEEQAAPAPVAAPQAALAFQLEKAAFLKALSHVQSVVERRNTIPILNNVRMDVEGSSLFLTATDMDIAVKEQVEVQGAKTGRTTTPAHMLYDIVRKLPDGGPVSVEVSDSGDRLTVSSGKASFTLPCLPVEDFPVMEEGAYSHNFRLSSTECVELIDKTRFAISTEETRYYLNGIYVHVAGEGDSQTLRAVATDGHRLARMEIATPAGAAGMPGIIVPRKTVGELRKVLDESDKEVEISLSESKIRFACGAVSLVSKLIDGTFPDYERVVPADNDKVMEVNTKLLAESVDRVATIATDKSRAVKLQLDQGALTLTADSPEHGDAREIVDAQYGADSLNIGYNSRYLLEMLNQIEGDNVQFVVADATAPTLVRDPGNIGALYVIMPMRV